MPHYDEMFIQLFSQTMTQMEAMLPVDTNIREAYSNGHDAEQQFIQDLALFFCAYLKGMFRILYISILDSFNGMNYLMPSHKV